MTKRVLIATTGSLGDLHPYIAIGLELRSRGVAVTIATNNYYRTKVEHTGLGFAPMGPHIAPVNSEVMQRAMDGGKSRTIAYEMPRELYSELFPWFQSESEMLVRHREEICLGSYSMKQIKEFVAALQTLCAIHDHLCFLAAQRRREFPVNSAVLVKKRDEWVRELSSISGMDRQAAGEILGDLTFGDRVPIDLHSELFVPLDKKADFLAVVPHFGLSARVDENLLRTLSRTDKKAYDRLSEIKEEEMLDELRFALPKAISAFGPYELPKDAKTNLDLVIVDEPGSTVLLVELKWIRKPLFAKETSGRLPSISSPLALHGGCPLDVLHLPKVIQVMPCVQPYDISDRFFAPLLMHAIVLPKFRRQRFEQRQVMGTQYLKEFLGLFSIAVGIVKRLRPDILVVCLDRGAIVAQDMTQAPSDHNFDVREVSQQFADRPFAGRWLSGEFFPA